jgi:transcriptional regulator with XRE-family HTH domain
VPDFVRDALVKRSLCGLSNSELAKRLGVGRSTISDWKRDKTSDEFLHKTRDKDPSRIGWVFNQETNRFTPEREIPRDSPRVTQSELPGISIPEEVEF